ncbi:LCP family protein [Adlercreutzia sp. ZJ305]|uniref:LCP family protein n=1 Tax=Adlercreutzia sp. ZJ305 TaxID=2709408 RepID=UPI001F151114|nr:LCP family protein [Adlercreutzia sp. ZJ305]
MLVIALGGASAFAIYLDSVNSKLKQGTKTSDEIAAIDDVLRPASALDEPFYMMLIGSDMRENNDEMGARSDTNILVRVDPSNDQVTMVSIPRDTKVELDGYGTNKFNAIYNFEGTAGVISETKKLLGVDISYYAEVNFGKLVDLVNAVGGVDVEVEELIDDPDADRPESGRHIVIQEGLQHLDGEEALVFARCRAYADGDFTRTANQRKLIEAIVDKVLSAPVTSLPGIIEKASDCVTTNLSVSDIITLAQQFKSDGGLTIYSGMVPSWTQTIDGISYVINDAKATKEMMAIVEAGEDPSTVVSSGAPAPEESSSSSTSASTSSENDSGYGYGYDPGYSNPPSYYEPPADSGADVGAGDDTAADAPAYGSDDGAVEAPGAEASSPSNTAPQADAA